MPTTLCTFRGRRRGAIGIFYPVTVRSQAEGRDAVEVDVRRFWETETPIHMAPDPTYDAAIRDAAAAEDELSPEDLRS